MKQISLAIAAVIIVLLILNLMKSEPVSPGALSTETRTTPQPNDVPDTNTSQPDTGTPSTTTATPPDSAQDDSTLLAQYAASTKRSERQKLLRELVNRGSKEGLAKAKDYVKNERVHINPFLIQAIAKHDAAFLKDFVMTLEADDPRIMSIVSQLVTREKEFALDYALTHYEDIIKNYAPTSILTVLYQRPADEWDAQTLSRILTGYGKGPKYPEEFHKQLLGLSRHSKSLSDFEHIRKHLKETEITPFTQTVLDNTHLAPGEKRVLLEPLLNKISNPTLKERISKL